MDHVKQICKKEALKPLVPTKKNSAGGKVDWKTPAICTQQIYSGAIARHSAAFSLDNIQQQHATVDTFSYATNSYTAQAPASLASADAPCIATALPLMHDAECTPERARYCLGCSVFWKAAQAIQEPLRPWSPSDMMRYDVDNTNCLFGEVAVNESFVSVQESPLHTEMVHTFYSSSNKDAEIIWCFIAPHHSHKVRKLIGAGNRFKQTNFLPSMQELKDAGVEVVWGVQSVMDTVIVPAGWLSFHVFSGEGVHVAGFWRLLRSNRLIAARRVAHHQRMMGLPHITFSLSAIVHTAAYRLLDELDGIPITESDDRALRRKKHALIHLKYLLPLLQLDALEDALAEPLSPSGLAALSYEATLLALDGSNNVHAALTLHQKVATGNEKVRRSFPRSDAKLSSIAQCAICDVRLFNLRRACDKCSIALCLACHEASGHEHQMAPQRRLAASSVRGVASAVATVLGFHQVAAARYSSVLLKRAARADEQADQPLALHVAVFGGAMPIKRRRRNAGNAAPYGSGVSPAPIATAGTVYTSKFDDDEEEEEEEVDSEHERILKPGENDDDDDEDRIDCICGRNDDKGFMLFCERCRVWLHGKCVSVTKKTEPDHFFCPRCV